MLSTRVALLAAIVCALANPGNFGTIDTARRLQVARWIRLGEPPVRADDARFGLVGRDGLRHAWFGVGQSLVLLPFDAVISAGVSPLAERARLDRVRRDQLVELLIAFSMQTVILTCILAFAHTLLGLLGFGTRSAMAGALALLFATTCLVYVQCAQENLLLLALSLGALCAVLRWHRSGAAMWASAGGAACGFAILVRLSSVIETAVIAGFAISISRRPRAFLAAFAPPVVASILLDRWYHWTRFGELFSTYMGIFARQLRPEGAPASFPFSYPFWDGFLGTLFSPSKSIFIFDPLLLVVVVLAIGKWRAIPRELRVLLLSLALLLALYVALYARWFWFGGDVAWGHRFMTLPVHLICLFAVPLLLAAGARARRATWMIAGAAVVLQASSTMVATNLEVLQREKGHGSAVIWNRAVNLAELATGRDQGPRYDAIPPEWRSLNYFPFQLRFRFPELARWAIAAWVALLLVLPVIVWRMLKTAAGTGH
ncbi:MAG: hypothetical protein ACRD8O_09035 [Bryobacteraceae bacterium]